MAEQNYGRGWEDSSIPAGAEATATGGPSTGLVPVEVDLLVAEAKRYASAVEGLAARPELLVEGAGRGDVGDGEDEVLKPNDAHLGLR
jgi:hypothetical protein